MNIKQRFSLFFSTLFSILLAAVMLVVYYLFSNFRTEEFKARLAQKAETTVKLLLDVKEVDYHLLKIIDRNSINRLYNEKTLIFDENMQLIYNSIDDATINWSRSDLEQIKKDNVVFRKTKEYDVLGLYYDFDERDYYVLISAEDKYGNSKLNYLKYLLLGAFLLGTAAVWMLSFYLSKKSLRPLDIVTRKIQEITDKNLKTRLEEQERQDEIHALSYSFNQMMDRIDKAYSRQKEFTGNASHELRTPVARIVTQLENLQQNKELDDCTRRSLKSISDDGYQLSDIVTSLLLLSQIDNIDGLAAFQKIRLDEIVFNTAAQLGKTYPDIKLQFEIENTTAHDVDIEVKGDETLLGIAVTNLLKNAYHYSDNKVVNCTIKQNADTVEIFITNTGEVPEVQDTSLLFRTFTRGSNVHSKPGSGVGLSIVQRIVHYHSATIAYNIYDRLNEIVVTFRK